MDQDMQNVMLPSLYKVRCPNCGSANFKMVGQLNAAKNYSIKKMVLDAVDIYIDPENEATHENPNALEYSCNDCKESFLAGPFVAAPEEILQTPATISIERLKNMYGCAVSFIIYCNGCKVGEVKNGKTFTFQTWLRYNIVAVTSVTGVAFKESTIRFEAQPGGTIYYKFNQKFL